MKRFFIFFLLSALMLPAGMAQVNKYVSWSFTTQPLGHNEFLLNANASITEGYHLYSQKSYGDDGPVPTTFTFDPGADYVLEGTTAESGNAVEKTEPLFNNIKLKWFEGNATFSQKILIKKAAFSVTGKVNFMTCNDKFCTPPSDVVFTFNINAPDFDAAVKTSATDAVKTAGGDSAKADVKKDSAGTDSSVSVKKVSVKGGNTLEGESYWGVFLLGIGSGIIALLMPCVWPVIPLTVSFFLKQNKDSRRGRINAIFYGLSITLIFVLLGILVSLFTNEQKLNELSSSWFFNILFFVLFFLFSLSFLGMFEIRVPSAWINKSEQLSDKGGFLGIFFMAFTLVLVSFSCTLPFIGNLIKLVSEGGQFMKPLIGFSAFGITLGLPFAFFAYFPSMLKNLPKSGGWMTTLKVFFGFIELALCFIYLSKVDLAYHWGFLSRDVFLAIWIMVFAVLGFYLLGKVHLPHHDEMNHISVPRLLSALASLAFALYMVPGLWGAPLKGLSGFLPNYREFDIHSSVAGSSGRTAPKFTGEKKYAELFHAPGEPDMDLFFDFQQAFDYAKKIKKPLFIDFTGHACVNCRYNEQNVWPDAEVAKRLENDYVCVSLYVDDKTSLPPAERFKSSALDKTVETIGDKNSDIQLSRFKLPLAQPYYVLLDNEGNLLNEPLGGKTKPGDYVKFLDAGVAAFKKTSNSN